MPTPTNMLTITHHCHPYHHSHSHHKSPLSPTPTTTHHCHLPHYHSPLSPTPTTTHHALSPTPTTTHHCHLPPPPLTMHCHLPPPPLTTVTYPHHHSPLSPTPLPLTTVTYPHHPSPLSPTPTTTHHCHLPPTTHHCTNLPIPTSGPDQTEMFSSFHLFPRLAWFWTIPAIICWVQVVKRQCTSSSHVINLIQHHVGIITIITDINRTHISSL